MSELVKVKFHTLDAGPLGVRHAGEVHEVSVEEAKALIDARAAERVKSVAPRREKAVTGPRENATLGGSPAAPGAPGK